MTHFKKAMTNLGKVLKGCQEINLPLSHEKCHMLLTKGIILGHHISRVGNKVNPTKIKVISNLPIPKM